MSSAGGRGIRLDVVSSCSEMLICCFLNLKLFAAVIIWNLRLPIDWYWITDSLPEGSYAKANAVQYMPQIRTHRYIIL